MDEATAKRLAENERRFRLVNDLRVDDLEDESVADREHEPAAIVCECAREACVENLDVPLVEYERIRTDPERYVVAPGHQVLEIEDVVERHEEYLVVKKRV